MTRRIKPSREALMLKMRIWENGLTQRQVADSVGLCEVALSEYLSGRRNLKPETLAAIDECLDRHESAIRGGC